MKTYIQLEYLLPLEPTEIGGIKYLIQDLYKLHGYHIPVHKYFDSNKEIITNGYFNWDFENNILSLQIWIRSDEVNFFEELILKGQLIPINVRFTPDNINDDSVKNLTDSDIDNMVEEAQKCLTL